MHLEFFRPLRMTPRHPSNLRPSTEENVQLLNVPFMYPCLICMHTRTIQSSHLESSYFSTPS